jgi:hypothetical protein
VNFSKSMSYEPSSGHALKGTRPSMPKGVNPSIQYGVG